MDVEQMSVDDLVIRH